ncbi:hypothetical protein EVAR_52005_1 [Eumeta japonica]|uniref:Uncharacterized protein n=1 Tax=Eumeta variegata TaxID=151549 RepID=A0A4C1XYH7_EUMVA|nr:hypothetical protein EVAR_52005_1 [Eumeta japonica]
MCRSELLLDSDRPVSALTSKFCRLLLHSANQLKTVAREQAVSPKVATKSLKHSWANKHVSHQRVAGVRRPWPLANPEESRQCVPGFLGRNRIRDAREGEVK